MIINKSLQILIQLFRRLAGIFVTILAIYYALILITFDVNDPSFNTFSTENHIKNFGGIYGARIADLSFQIIGLSSFIGVIFTFSLGLQMTNIAGVQYFLSKLIIIPICILSFCLMFALVPKPSWWEFSSLGGVNGSFLLLKLQQFPKYAIFIASFSLALMLFSIIVEVSLKDWIYSFRFTFIWLRYVVEKYLLPKDLNNIFDNLLSKNSPKIIPNNVDKKIIENNQEFEDEGDMSFEAEVAKTSNEDLKKQLKSSSKIKKPKHRKSSYVLPTCELLTDRSAENKDKKVPKELVESQSKMLLKVLDDFGVRGVNVGTKVGPVITLHEFEPEAGTKASRVISLSDDIARSMSAVSARIAVVAGKTSIGIELPNPKREMIFLREILESRDYKFSQFSLPMILGKDIGGEFMIADLAKMPHLLIAGTTGSGKSVGLNVMILSLLFKLRPDECKFIMIDPKMLELSIYDGIPHLLSPVVTEPGKAVIALKWVVAEMEERYRLMSSFAVRNIAGYNEKAEKAMLDGEKLMRKVQTGYDPTTGKPIIEEIEFEPKKLPFIVVVVDEMADLMLVAGKEIENSVQRLAQMARAAGIHLIMATQRPSVDVITGVIKANFPTRISFQVTSRIDSRTILGTQGAEQLLGQGDMIFMSGGSKMVRVHGPFCSDTEIENIVNYIKSQDSSEFEESEHISFEVPIPNAPSAEAGGYEGGDDSDDNNLYNKAVMIVRRDKKASISYVQRQLRIGYNRAATLIEKMEENGIVSAPNISGKREIIEE
jgi:S-DNA-T family DNA segregation ATPase FtsK/SpoIIIE